MYKFYLQLIFLILVISFTIFKDIRYLKNKKKKKKKKKYAKLQQVCPLITTSMTPSTSMGPYNNK